MAEAMSQLGECDYEGIHQRLSGTDRIPGGQHGRIKMIWKQEQSIWSWANASASPVLILRGDLRVDRAILSCVSSHIIKDALECSSDSIVVLQHFCHENRENGDQAVTVMMQSLIRQLLSTRFGPSILPPSKNFFSACCLKDLCEKFEGFIRALPPHTSVVCVIDGLQSYCKRFIGEARAKEMEWLVPHFIRMASDQQRIGCRFKLLLTTSEVLPVAISTACSKNGAKSHMIGRRGLDNQGIETRFWRDNKLAWA